MNHVKEKFADVTSSTPNKKRKLVFYAVFFFFFLFLFATLVLVAAAVERSSANDVVDHDHAAHSIIKSSCSSTLYPDLCFSTISKVAGDGPAKIKSPKDVIEASLNLTITSVQHNYFTIKKIIAVDKTKRALTKRELTALHDCLELVDETLDELFKAEQDLRDYNNSSSPNKSIIQHADHLKSLLSGAMTNQQTCLDGFSHDKADKKVREALTSGQLHVYHMCSNALAMIRNITDSDMANHYSPAEENGKNEWPNWLSAGDRRLLQAPTVTPDVVVAADGSGNYRTVSEAVAAAPEGSSRRYIIKIKAGVYRENVDVPKKKINLMFVGDGRTNTIITGSRNVVDGSTTFNSATVGKFNSSTSHSKMFGQHTCFGNVNYFCISELD